MRFFLFFLIFVPTQILKSQSQADTLKNLSIEWMKALERKDAPMLERFLSKDFTLSTLGDSGYVDRATWLKNAIDKTWSNTSYRFKGVRVESNQAVVNSVLSFTVKPIPFLMRSEVLDHWVFEDGRWQIVTRYLGGNSIDNFFKAAKGYIVGVSMILVVLWLRRFRKKTI